MGSQDKETLLIGMINEAGSFVREEFTSAAGIRGNLKIDLPRALDRNPETLSLFAGAMAEELRDVDVIAANGGAVSLSREVERITGKPRVVICSHTLGGVKNFRLPDHTFSHLKGDPAVGIIEDVSSTLGSVERMLAQTGLGALATKIVVGWRRGQSAPEGMPPEEIDRHNQLFAFRDLYEHPLKQPVSSVIERYLPLWLPTEKQLTNYIPEVRR